MSPRTARTSTALALAAATVLGLPHRNTPAQAFSLVCASQTEIVDYPESHHPFARRIIQRLEARQHERRYLRGATLGGWMFIGPDGKDDDTPSCPPIGPR